MRKLLIYEALYIIGKYWLKHVNSQLNLLWLVLETRTDCCENSSAIHLQVETRFLAIQSLTIIINQGFWRPAPKMHEALTNDYPILRWKCKMANQWRWNSTQKFLNYGQYGQNKNIQKWMIVTGRRTCSDAFWILHFKWQISRPIRLD